MLDALLVFPPLLAADDVLRNMARGFQGKSAEEDASSLFLVLAVCGAFFMLVWGLSRFFGRKERLGSFHSPKSLFLALCRTHRLTREDRRLLVQLSRFHRLAQPAELFLQPERFAPEDAGKALRQRAERLLQLRNQLFAEAEPGEAEPTSRSETHAAATTSQAIDQPAPVTRMPAASSPLDLESSIMGDDRCPLSAY